MTSLYKIVLNKSWSLNTYATLIWGKDLASGIGNKKKMFYGAIGPHNSTGNF